MNNSFNDFYNKIENEDLRKMWKEANEERLKRNRIILSIIIIVDTLIIMIALSNINKIKSNMFYAFSSIHMIMVMLVIDLLIFVIISAIFSKKYFKYNDIFKEKVIDRLFKNFFDEVDYIPKKEMPENIYNEGDYEKYDEYSANDYLDGSVAGKYKIKMADITTKEIRVERDSDGNTRTTHVTIFSGIFAKINLDKVINSKLRIQKNSLILENRLEMDHSEFEKYFDVICDNKIDAMQILTHDIMEKILDYRMKLKNELDIYLKSNAIYIRLHTGETFEAKINKKDALDEKTVKVYYEIVEFIYSIALEIIKAVENAQLG